MLTVECRDVYRVDLVEETNSSEMLIMFTAVPQREQWLLTHSG
jgi:hypothetical protein